MARSVLPLLVVLLTLGLTAPAARAEDTELRRLVAQLDDENASRRSAALTELRKTKDTRAIPLLVDAAARFELYGRYYVVLALESYPPKAVKGAFTRLLRQEDPYVRLCAATFFLRQGDGRHVPVIVEALRTPGVALQARMYMVNRLYSLADPRIREALCTLLVPEAPVTLVASVLWAMQQPEGEASKAAARKLLETDARADVQMLAAAFLYRFGEEARKAEIVAAFETGGFTTTALSRVRMFLRNAGHVSKEILDAAAAALSTETNAILLRYLVEFLTEYRHKKALTRIRKLAAHENADLSKAAFEAVAQMGGSFEREELQAMLASDAAPRRLAAADLLRRMDDLSGLDVVVEILEKGEELERRQAAQSLGKFRVRRAVDPLIDALLDENLYVRTYALSAIDGLLRALFPYRRLDLVAAGYTAAAPRAQREAAVAKLRAWWEAHRDRDW